MAAEITKRDRNSIGAIIPSSLSVMYLGMVKTADARMLIYPAATSAFINGFLLILDLTYIPVRKFLLVLTKMKRGLE